MDVNFRRGIFRIKIVVSVILSVAIFLYAYDEASNDNYWTEFIIMTVGGTFVSVAGLWVGCWLIEKIGRWIIRGFTQIDARKTK